MIRNELIKNLKIIFRNWASLLLLVLGPLIIILIIGLTFAADEPHSVTIGIHGTSSIITEGIEEFGKTIPYSTIDLCIDDLRHSRVHLCLDVLEGAGGDIEQSTIVFYFDSSQKKLSNIIVGAVKESLGQSAEDISIEVTTNILDRIQSLVIFLSDKQQDISTFIMQANATRQELVVRGERLQNAKETFDPRHEQVQKLQRQFHNLSNVTAVSAQSSIMIIDAAIASITAASVLSNNSMNTTAQANATMQAALDRLRGQLLSQKLAFGRAANQTANVTRQVGANIDAIVRELDAIAVLIDEEIAFNNQAIERIDQSIAAMSMIRDELQEDLDELVVFDPSIAEQLVRPLVEEFSALENFDNVQIVFPGLLVMVLVFVTLLFSNILTLSEINSPAYFRNLIAPAPSLTFARGIVVTNILLVLLQLTVLLIIAQWQFQVDVFSKAAWVYGACIFLIFIFTLIGMSLAYFIKDSQTSVLTTTFVALGFYLFSNIITPLELMPQTVSWIASFNPVVIATEMLRLLLLYNIPFDPNDLLLFGVYAMLMIGITIGLHKRYIRTKR